MSTSPDAPTTTSQHPSIANAHYARPATDLGQQITTLYAHINVATAPPPTG